MRNLWMILPYWLFVYVLYRGMCVTIYDFCGWALVRMGGPVEYGVVPPKLNFRELVLRHMIFLVVAALLFYGTSFVDFAEFQELKSARWRKR